VAVISGGDWEQFEEQLLSVLPGDQRLENLSILPTCGTQFFQYAGGWKKLYSEDLSADEKAKIISSLAKALESNGLKSERVWGEVIEDRGSQVTLSALGQPLWKKRRSGTPTSPRGRGSRRPSTPLSLSSPSEWAAQHRLMSPSLASTRPTGSGSYETS
jgi:hypothetical protein